MGQVERQARGRSPCFSLSVSVHNAWGVSRIFLPRGIWLSRLTHPSSKICSKRTICPSPTCSWPSLRDIKSISTRYTCLVHSFTDGTSGCIWEEDSRPEYAGLPSREVGGGGDCRWDGAEICCDSEGLDDSQAASWCGLLSPEMRPACASTLISAGLLMATVPEETLRTLTRSRLSLMSHGGWN